MIESGGENKDKGLYKRNDRGKSEKNHGQLNVVGVSRVGVRNECISGSGLGCTRREG